MPELDRDTGRLLVRIAFDGPPLAGKTATLRSLGDLLDVPVESMDEAYGRTLWFDWMRYLGGMYDGRPIDCEVVSVPGQRALERRRRRILAEADAVVFVVDASPGGHEASLQAWRRFVAWRASRRHPPGVVVQANKRDLAGAWDADDVRHALDLPEEVVVVESVATDSTGVRRAFVFAVREAIRLTQRVLVEDGPLESAPARSAGRLMTTLRGVAVR
jgi:signal recognition particle receptor subunit beta